MVGQNPGKHAADRLSFSIMSLFAGIIISLLFLLFGITLISVVVAITDWEDTMMATMLLQACSVTLGGFVSGRIAKRTGWLHGGLVGLFYRLLTVVFTGGGLGTLISLNSAWWGVLAFLTGVVGGIVGVNSIGGKRKVS